MNIDVSIGEIISLLVIAIGIFAVTVAARRKPSETDNTEKKDIDNTMPNKKK